MSHVTYSSQYERGSCWRSSLRQRLFVLIHMHVCVRRVIVMNIGMRRVVMIALMDVHMRGVVMITLVDIHMRCIMMISIIMMIITHRHSDPNFGKTRSRGERKYAKQRANCQFVHAETP